MLLGYAYNFDWNRAPLAVCYFQALASQYASFASIAWALVFTIKLYRLLVLCKQHEINDSRLHRHYYIFLTVYPIVGTILVSVVSIKERAVKARDFRCDIVDPIWVRLIGYNGHNLLITVLGTYFCVHSTIVVIQQLYKGKSLFQQHSTPIENTETTVRLSKSLSDGYTVKDNLDNRLEMFGLQSYPSITFLSSSANFSNNSSDDKKTVNNPQEISSYLTANVGKETLDKTHNITRVAAIRMVVFTIVYLIMNISVSVETVFSS
ncbi:5370_t:CDS:2 [Paraglomus occultum]|uniref:5370_t:CDS:1 n=1 Tax=Paraglomus occultum TaxID=144539 RepID=A0A9N9BXW2_9GLOM|nr:5370_t:CDS:2 [Paraglomus occultum]